ncbi:MAG: hypothetical protein AB8V23_03720 [Candidatus Midichloria sp.]
MLLYTLLQIKIVLILLNILAEKGANLNLQAIDGSTALYIVADKGHEDEILL